MGQDNFPLMETPTVPGIVLKHLKHSQLPPTWRKDMSAGPSTRFRVAVDPEGTPDEDGLLKAELLPDESAPKQPDTVPVTKAARTTILAKLARGKGHEDSEHWIALIKAGRTRSELTTPLS